MFLLFVYNEICTLKISVYKLFDLFVVIYFRFLALYIFIFFEFSKKNLSSTMATKKMMLIYLLLLFLNVNGDTLQEWKVDISSSSNEPFYYYWNKCVGSGHSALLLRSDWRQFMKYGHDNVGFQYVRAHAILDDDVGSVNGVNSFSFINIDKIYEYLLSINMKPYIEISFMPNTFKSGDATICHYKGNVSPPNNYNNWYNFIKQWVQHLVDFFGIDEVSTWNFEVWYVMNRITNTHCLQTNKNI